MNSRVEKTKLDVRCPHCTKRISWAWLIQYHSFQYTQLVYVCSACEQVIKMENAPTPRGAASLLSDPRLPKRK
jgi:DNA-directed RNA polymerase subunit RPC12/RpoP